MINHNTKRLFELTIFLFSTSLFSQTEVNKQLIYKLFTKGETYSISQIEEALLMSDWCGYYNKSENYRITFDDGTIIGLLNEKELNANNLIIKPECYQVEIIEDEFVYSINSNNTISRKQKNVNDLYSKTIEKKTTQIRESNSIDPILKFAPDEFFIINDKPVTKQEYLMHISRDSSNVNN